MRVRYSHGWKFSASNQGSDGPAHSLSLTRALATHNKRTTTIDNCCCFLLWLMLYIPVNIYGHVGTVRSPNHTFFLSKLDQAVNQYFVHILLLVTDNNPSRREWLSCFVWFDSLHPINNLSVIKRRVFLGWTSTKLGLMFLLKDTTQWRRWGLNPRPFGLESSTLPLSHCAPWRMAVEKTTAVICKQKKTLFFSSSLCDNHFCWETTSSRGACGTKPLLGHTFTLKFVLANTRFGCREDSQNYA